MTEPKARTGTSRDGRDQAMAAAYLGGMSLRQVAASFGVSTTPVRGALARTGTPVRAPGDPVEADPARDAAVVRAYRDGASLRAVAEQFGLSTRKVSDALEAAGVERRRSGPPAVIEDEQALSAYQFNDTMAQAAEDLDIHEATVRRALHRQGVDGHQTAGWRRRKVDHDHVRELLAQGMSQSAAARLLDVSVQTVHRIAHSPAD